MSKALDKALKMLYGQDIYLPEISDTWNLIDKYKLGYRKSNNKIVISLEEAKSKGINMDYIKRLSGMSKMYGRGDF